MFFFCFFFLEILHSATLSHRVGVWIGVWVRTVYGNNLSASHCHSTQLIKNTNIFHHNFHQWTICMVMLHKGHNIGWHCSTLQCANYHHQLPVVAPGLSSRLVSWKRQHDEQMSPTSYHPAIPSHPPPPVFADLIPLSIFSLQTRPLLWSGKITGLTCFGGEAVSDHR